MCSWWMGFDWWMCSNRSAQPMQVNYSKSNTVHRSRNLNNRISIKRLPFQPSKPSTKLLQYCVLNARSINNKTLHIKDYVVGNKIDILAITETWLKSDDDCYFTIRDICHKTMFSTTFQEQRELVVVLDFFSRKI